MAEEGYPYAIDPDHIPDHPDDPGNRQGYAHGYGYIKALIQAVDTLSPPYGVGVKQKSVVPFANAANAALASLSHFPARIDKELRNVPLIVDTAIVVARSVCQR